MRHDRSPFSVGSPGHNRLRTERRVISAGHRHMRDVRCLPPLLGSSASRLPGTATGGSSGSASGAVLPDLIDKPVGHISSRSRQLGRLFTRVALPCALLMAGIILERRQDVALLAVAEVSPTRSSMRCDHRLFPFLGHASRVSSPTTSATPYLRGLSLWWIFLAAAAIILLLGAGRTFSHPPPLAAWQSRSYASLPSTPGWRYAEHRCRGAEKIPAACGSEPAGIAGWSVRDLSLSVGRHSSGSASIAGIFRSTRNSPPGSLISMKRPVGLASFWTIGDMFSRNLSRSRRSSSLFTLSGCSSTLWGRCQPGNTLGTRLLCRTIERTVVAISIGSLPASATGNNDSTTPGGADAGRCGHHETDPACSYRRG